jgi:hypothetical protein
MFVNRSGAKITDQSEFPVARNSYYWVHSQPELAVFPHQHQYAWLHARFAPRPVPMVPRETPPFSNAESKSNLFRTNMGISQGANIHRPVRSPNGVVSGCNFQSYHFSELVRKMPKLPLIDGPRGVGKIAMPTSMHLDRVGGIHVLTPWSLVRMAPDGSIETRCGWRSRRDPKNGTVMGFSTGDGNYNAEAPQDLELVGDWSAIPPERHGFHETWGFAWDDRSLEIDGTAPLVGPPANRVGFEHPHLGAGPVAFIADSQNNRVVRLQFPATTHNPPVVTEFLTGLADPWDCVYHDGSLYVSERKANRIVEYDATTAALIRVVLQGPAYPMHAYIDSNRFVRRTSALATIRAQNCVLPEGLAYQDGWLYFGSQAMGQVKKVNLETGELLVACQPYTDNNSRYMKISLSDGTFGPRGTMFASTWSVARQGFPEAFLPDGTKWNYYSSAGNSPAVGRGNLGWASTSYGAAQAVGMGRLYFGTAAEGVIMISKALPSDPVLDKTRWDRGSQLWSQHFSLTHGPQGFDYQGKELPWGLDPDIDYFLEWQGHRRNETKMRVNLWVTADSSASLPSSGQAKLVAPSESYQAIRPPIKNEAQWRASLFESYGSGTFNPHYSTDGAFVITGTGGHNHQETFGAACFNFTTRAWDWVPAQIPERNTPIQVDETTGDPWYEMPGTEVPSPAHAYRLLSVISPALGGGPKGSMLYFGRAATANKDVPGDVSATYNARTCHRFDLATGQWSRTSGATFSHFSGSALIEGTTVYDPVLQRYYSVRSRLQEIKFLPYLSATDWSYGQTSDFSAFPAADASNYATATYCVVRGQRLVLHNRGQLFQVLDLGDLPRGFVQPPVSSSLSPAWPQTIISGADRGTQNAWVWHEAQGVLYYRHHVGAGNKLLKLTPPPSGDALTGTWTISEVTLAGDAIPEFHANPSTNIMHYRSLFYIPSLQMLGWVSPSGVCLLNP